jgi:thymidylate synthase
MTDTVFHFIVCTDANGCIGADGNVLYRAPVERQRFRSITNPVVGYTRAGQTVLLMGHTTWASVPEARRYLANRVRVVLTRSPQRAVEVRKCGAYPFARKADALAFIDQMGVDRVFVIGGASLWTDPLLRKRVAVLHHTLVHDDASATHAAADLVRVDMGAVPFNNFAVVEEWSADVPCCHFRHRKNSDSDSDSDSDGDGDGDGDDATPATLMKLTFRTSQRHVTAATVRTPSPPAEPPSARLSQPSLSSSGEDQYLALLRKVLDAPERQTRNSATRSTFGERIVVDLRDGTVPLLTTKKMAWKTIIRELLWFVRGETDNVALQKEKVHIWDANASREFLDSRGLTDRAENDLGPVYGFQWRHSGATYRDCHTDYTGQGVDQLEETRRQIVDDPQSRRMIFSAWNPTDLPQMALPPCHLLGQWYVSHDDTLWLQVYQRSGDLFLGVPFNLFSYSVLVHMMAHLTKRKVGGLVHILGDAHIYENHVDVVRKQLERPQHRAPQFRVKAAAGVEGVDAAAAAAATPTTWEDFTLDSFELTEYACEGALKADMVA